jgi:hypothetical protein
LKPLMPKVAQSKTTTRYLWQPTKWSIHKQIAGGINAENVFCIKMWLNFERYTWAGHHIISRIHTPSLRVFHNFLLPMRSDKKNFSTCLLKFEIWNSWNLVFSEQLDI